MQACQHRLAIVVAQPAEGLLNLQVFVDGTNDVPPPGTGMPPAATFWATGKSEGTLPGTWAKQLVSKK